jgi:hypothetical protein
LVLSIGRQVSRAYLFVSYFLLKCGKASKKKRRVQEQLPDAKKDDNIVNNFSLRFRA